MPISPRCCSTSASPCADSATFGQVAAWARSSQDRARAEVSPAAAGSRLSGSMRFIALGDGLETRAAAGCSGTPWRVSTGTVRRAVPPPGTAIRAGLVQPGLLELAGDLVLDRVGVDQEVVGLEPLSPGGADDARDVGAVPVARRIDEPRRTSSSTNSPSGVNRALGSGIRIRHRRTTPARPRCGVSRWQRDRVPRSCWLSSRARRSCSGSRSLVTLCDSSMTTASQRCFSRWAR